VGAITLVAPYSEIAGMLSCMVLLGYANSWPNELELLTSTLDMRWSERAKALVSMERARLILALLSSIFLR
jgi:hypothetical protein